ncbi:MAG: N-hydroxyarylamine O-acetyltransferase [Ilumatobacter sp.]|jgi:N-hydroxyarylamine O-acetyltransferase
MSAKCAPKGLITKSVSTLALYAAEVSSDSTTGPAIDVDSYLERIGFGGTVRHDRATLADLQQLHMTAVPFENLDIVDGHGVTVDAQTNVDKIVEQGRGGWCFELNGAFALLLEALGFRVLRLGAAVLLDGPTRVIDHLALEVQVDRPYLVDIGFGDSFTNPIDLNAIGPQDGGAGTYELIGSPQGTTLTRHDATGIPDAQYRFKRVAHTMDQFEPASESLQADPDKHWRAKRFATRLLDRGPDRVTLTGDRLKVVRDGANTETPISPSEWDATLSAWFGMHRRA